MGQLDAAQLQAGFVSLVRDADPTQLTTFFIWLDLKVTQFKISGQFLPDSAEHTSPVILHNKAMRRLFANGSESLPIQTSTPTGSSNDSTKSLLYDCLRYRGLLADWSAERKGVGSSKESSPIGCQSNGGSPVGWGTCRPAHTHSSSPVDLARSGQTLPISPGGSTKASQSHDGSLTYIDAHKASVYIPHVASPLSGAQVVSPHPIDFSRPERASVPPERASVPTEHTDSVKSLLRAALIKARSFELPREELVTRVGQSPANDEALKKADVLRASRTEAGGEVSHGQVRFLLGARSQNILETRQILDIYSKPLVFEPNGSEPGESEPDGRSLEPHDLAVEPGKNRCPYCAKTFQYRSSYRRHVKIHQGIFSHECLVCLRKFTRKEHYVRHKCNRRPNKPNRSQDLSLSPQHPPSPLSHHPCPPSPHHHPSPCSLLYHPSPHSPPSSPGELVIDISPCQTSASSFFSFPKKLCQVSQELGQVNLSLKYSVDQEVGRVGRELGQADLASKQHAGFVVRLDSASDLVEQPIRIEHSTEAANGVPETLVHESSRRKSSTPRKVIARLADETNQGRVKGEQNQVSDDSCDEGAKERCNVALDDNRATMNDVALPRHLPLVAHKAESNMEGISNGKVIDLPVDGKLVKKICSEVNFSASNMDDIDSVDDVLVCRESCLEACVNGRRLSAAGHESLRGEETIPRSVIECLGEDMMCDSPSYSASFKGHLFLAGSECQSSNGIYDSGRDINVCANAGVDDLKCRKAIVACNVDVQKVFNLEDTNRLGASENSVSSVQHELLSGAAGNDKNGDKAENLTGDNDIITRVENGIMSAGGATLTLACTQCSKTFQRSSNFARHMRIHRGVHSYVCATCTRGFFRREHFLKHKCDRRAMALGLGAATGERCDYS